MFNFNSSFPFYCYAKACKAKLVSTNYDIGDDWLDIMNIERLWSLLKTFAAVSSLGRYIIPCNLRSLE